jgi:Uma2 family endonuclease
MMDPARARVSSAHARRGNDIAEEGYAVHMATVIKRWSLDELHSLPDDGNKYELIDGELFVTPAPTDEHETIAARLTRILDPYVALHGLGFVYRPRAVVRTGSRKKKSEVEPDLMVRQPQSRRKAQWEDAPIPILVVEIESPYTRRRDHMQKRDHYMKIGVREYWIVDPEEQGILQIRAGEPDIECRDRIIWSPDGATAPLEIETGRVFE